MATEQTTTKQDAAALMEATLKETIAHLEKVLNGCRSHSEQQAADKAARDFLSGLIRKESSMVQIEAEAVAKEGSDFAVLTAAFRKLGIEFLVRSGDRSGNHGYSYVFVSPRASLSMTAANLSVENVSLETLQLTNHCFEFDEVGSIASS